MSGKALKTQLNYRIFALAMSAVALAGCDENGELAMPSFGDGASETNTTVDAPAVSLVERDVEAPDVFSVSENGLWDGRPSLGGVWVAHPDVKDPERVIIRNEANGEFVIGALFRRERDNPGPALQISSDAAEELSVLAGAPTVLNVVALRREEAPVEPPVLETASFDAPEAVAATSLDAPEPAPVTTSALDTLSSIAESAPTPEPAMAPESDALVGAAAIAIAAAEAASDAAPVETAALAPAEPAPQPTPARASSLDKPFVQIGIFSVEENARQTAQRLSNDGLLGTVLAQSSNGRPFWRVVVGPSPTSADRAEVIRKVKTLGFNDAYAVTN